MRSPPMRSLTFCERLACFLLVEIFMVPRGWDTKTMKTCLCPPLHSPGTPTGYFMLIKQPKGQLASAHKRGEKEGRSGLVSPGLQLCL